MKNLLRALSIGCLVFTAGCTKAGFFAVNLPEYFNGITVTRDVAFGAQDEQKLDIYSPPDDGTKKKRGVIVFFYGGRWETGKKSDYRFAGAALARAGFVVVIPDYRKYPEVRFPVFVQDAAKAVVWVADNIESYGGDPGRLYVAGHSSGAHIGALVSADPRYLAAEGRSRDIIKGFAGLSGPYAFTPDEPDLQDMFGPPTRYPDMRVTTFIDGHEPPMLLLYGDADETVRRFNLDRLQDAIRRKGGCVQSRIYPGIDHVWTVGALSWLGRKKAPVLADITAFFQGIGTSGNRGC